MPTKREPRELSEFFKFTTIGQVVAGKIEKFGRAGQYDTQYMILEPACIRETEDGNPRKFGGVAIGLSADLLAKINPRSDSGTYISIQFTGREPSGKGKPRKIFEVLELREDEYTRLEKRASGEYANNVYRSDRDSDELSDADEDGDGLPF